MVLYLMKWQGLCVLMDRKCDTDLCISFTGNAGPDAMEGKKVGLIYIGIAYKSDVHTYEYELWEVASRLWNRLLRLKHEDF